jgi:hypothetical protein
MDTTNNRDNDKPIETADETRLMGEAILDRARAVSERITKRCRQLTGESGPDAPGDQKD